MRSKKETILIYLEIREMIEKLTKEQAGTIFMAILDYCDTGTIPKLDPFLEMVFIPIRQSLDRSKKQYESRCEKNRAAALKRWGKTEEAVDAILTLTLTLNLFLSLFLTLTLFRSRSLRCQRKQRHTKKNVPTEHFKMCF